jgi:hypothetical protein
MSFDPTKPADHANIVAAELRNQFNALQAQIVALQQQFAPLVPVLSRDAGGHWTLTYAGIMPDYWQIWVRYEGRTAWSNNGELRSDSFPAPDDTISPGGAWWQVKVCGQDGNDNPCTPFSNVISFGHVPEI